MGMIYPMQMLLASITLLLAFPLATSSIITTTSKEEIKCDSCTPIVTYPSPPPPVVECPPPPSPPSLPPPPPSPPPPPACPACPGSPPPPCSWCYPPCISCPPLCPGCPPPPCNVCQVPNVPDYQSAASSTHLELKLVVSIIFLLLSATFSFF